ncbi:hypothetical protein HYPSUDRAFT_673073 [Hypholoma sublateritium FD-334 SS-4]|uniref:Uncharacterized protein n=1 Tax=Hypholoma sublateritium (strain FD-334 SS-4) TaxID=945553 RepID=A0A0D2NT46_HYPSF|nr:hypothetical protein HYPSUDRAFT_673073 [Hypholoma sublateritium FD-334 SS-4]
MKGCCISIGGGSGGAEPRTGARGRRTVRRTGGEEIGWRWLSAGAKQGADAEAYEVLNDMEMQEGVSGDQPASIRIQRRRAPMRLDAGTEEVLQESGFGTQWTGQRRSVGVIWKPRFALEVVTLVEKCTTSKLVGAARCEICIWWRRGTK